MIYILLFIAYIAGLMWFIICFAGKWRDSIRKKFTSDTPSILLTVAAVFFTLISPVIGFYRYDQFAPELPFSPNHVAVIELLVAFSVLCYWASVIWKPKLSAPVNLVVRAGLLQGILLAIVITVHFGLYPLIGLLFPFFGFELIAPPFAALLLFYELKCNYGVATIHLNSPGDDLNKRGFPILVLPALLAFELGFMTLFGYEWNSLFLAFSESRGFLFSENFQ